MITGEIKVDERGRTNLTGVRSQPHRLYLAEEHEDGTIVLTPAAVITAAELERLRRG